MKKIIKTIIILIIFTLLLLILYFGGNHILNNFALYFRPWVDTLVLITVGILVEVVFVLSIVIFGKLFHKLGKPTKTKLILKGLCITGIVLCIVLELLIAWITLIGLALGYSKEHVIERDNMKMVAVVESFLDVNIYYYPYKNWIVMGNNKLIDEWYGSGGYDPLDGEHTSKPLKTIYYYEQDSIIGD